MTQYTHKFDPDVDVSFVISVAFVVFEQLGTQLHQVDNVAFSSALGKVLIRPVDVP